MNLEKTTGRVKKLFEKNPGFSGTMVFDFGNDGVISVDGKANPPAVSNDLINSDCNISIALEDFNQILDGALDPQMAFMSGKLTVDGDMGIALNLAGVLKG